MPNYLEIIRLHELSFSQRNISKMCHSGRNTVARTVKIAKDKQLFYQELSTWENSQIDAVFSPKKLKRKENSIEYVLPDFEYLAKELVKPGVTMPLLWEEYVVDCRRNNRVYYRLMNIADE
ncbi:hypothetical protein [Fundicoccus culcitae]|uniref:Transposase n=1 Tax=Fundicoccus culcitae TaxID=2969821 RepID=A0ABY5P9G4_9LACT|nr:hypothetical protein [Fundicoccus culcitae]UUX35236.1 hypothetical protein NRE15_06225 [Fundicoccus culcitae]